jgi:hypothetical protein
MPQRNRNRTLVISALGLLIAWPFVVAAFNPQPEPPGRFGMVGLAFGQTARLNAVNLLPPDPVVPREPCQGTLGFLNSEGQTFVDSGGGEIVKEVSIGAGHAEFLDMPASEVVRRGRRVQFRAGLELRHAELPPDPCLNIVATLEVFDDLTGRTMVLYPSDPVAPIAR